MIGEILTLGKYSHTLTQWELPVPSAESKAPVEGAFLELVFGADGLCSARLAAGRGAPIDASPHTIT